MAWWSRGPPISTPVPSVNIPRSVPTRRTPVTPVPTRHPLASSLLTPFGTAPIVDIVFAPIVASHPQRTGETFSVCRRNLHGQKQSRVVVRVTCDCTAAQLHRQMGGSFGTQVYSKFGRSRLKERRREEVIRRNNRVLDEVSQARIVVSYVERRSG